MSKHVLIDLRGASVVAATGRAMPRRLGKCCPAARQSPSEPISNGAISAAKVDLSLSPGTLQPSALHNAQAVPLLSGARPGMRFIPALAHRSPGCSRNMLNKLCH